MSPWQVLIEQCDVAARMCTRAMLTKDLDAAARWATAFDVLEAEATALMSRVAAA